MKSPEEGLKSMFENLQKNTGKSMEQWIESAKASGLTKHREILKYLQTEHGLTYGFANQIALRSTAAGAAADKPDDDLVAEQYSGAKAAQKPIYDALLATINKFGGDVEVSPKKAYVSIRRSKQFCIIQPAATRVDVGINLKGTPPTERLEPSGSFNAMVSHRVRVSGIGDIDSELEGWLKEAYSAA
jgi:predicted transport protein